MPFAEGYKLGAGLGQKIGGVLGNASSGFAQDIAMKQFSADLQVQTELNKIRAKEGLGIDLTKDGMKVDPNVWAGASEKELAIGLAKYKKYYDDIVQQNTINTIKVMGQFSSTLGTIQDMMENDNWSGAQAAANMLQELSTREELGGMPNGFRVIGKLTGLDKGIDLAKMVANKSFEKEFATNLLITLDNAHVKAVKDGDIKSANDILSTLRAVALKYNKIAKEHGISADRRISETETMYESQAGKVARELQETAKANQQKLVQLEAEEKIKAKYKGDFNINMNRLVDLEKNGQTDSPEYNRRMEFFQKQVAKSGSYLKTNQDGTLTWMQGDIEGIQNRLTGQQALKQQEQLDRYETTMGFISEAIDNIDESPTRAGAWGSIRGFAQKALGIAGDIAPETLKDTIASTVNGAINALPLDENQKENLSKYFDPKIPENEILGNTIALELAKMRVTAGGGGIRALESAFKSARKDVALTGKFSSQEAMTRLNKVYKEFEVERNKLERRLKGKSHPTDINDLLNMYAPKE